MHPMVARIQENLISSNSLVSLECDGNILNNIEILTKINQNLQRFSDLGLEPGKRIGIEFNMGADYIVLALSIWFYGSSFVPISPQEPQARRDLMCRNARVAAYITVGEPGFDEPMIKILEADTTPDILSGDDSTAPKPEAYVIFTSGSTGFPKGVSVSLDSLQYYFNSVFNEYCHDYGELTAIAHLAPTFDANLTTSLFPLFAGMKVIALSDADNAIGTLEEVLRSSDFPVFLKVTPAQVRLLGGLMSERDRAKLRGTMIIGGENLSYEDLSSFIFNNHINIINEYGPTETTVGCIYFKVDLNEHKTGSVAIGHPLAGTSVRLDAGDGSLSEDPILELIIKGPGVANGYINGISDNRFFVDDDGSRAYRTGDFVTITPGGVLVFHGRRDTQIKYNGFRIDTGEIESVVKAAGLAVHSVVLLEKDDLVLALETNEAVDAKHAITRLSEYLPNYMVPSRIVYCNQLPMGRHGKVDIAALRSSISTVTAQSRDELADLYNLVRERWETLLLRSDIDPSTNFFISGGNSIAALKLIGSLSMQTGTKIPFSTIFKTKDLQSFVEEIRRLVEANHFEKK